MCRVRTNYCYKKALRPDAMRKKKMESRRTKKKTFLTFTKLCVLGGGRGDMDCIDVAHNRDRWWTLLNAIINLSSTIKCGKSLD
jgi:hypothetical protein